MNLSEIKTEDKITRMICGTMPMELKVSQVTEDFIYCGPWKFLRASGGEVDEDLGWDGYNTGSFIKDSPMFKEIQKPPTLFCAVCGYSEAEHKKVTIDNGGPICGCFHQSQ